MLEYVDIAGGLTPDEIREMIRYRDIHLLKHFKKESVKMKEKLSKREKKMLCIGGSMVLVSAGLAAYFGIKYYDQTKLNKIVNEELQTVKDDLQLVKFLAIEGELVPKALQNAKNKLQRVQSKIENCYKFLDKHPGHQSTIDMIGQLKVETVGLINSIYKAEQLQDKLNSDLSMYA